MKTPEEWSAGQFLKGYRSLTDFVAAIQADAQRGMMSFENVRDWAVLLQDLEPQVKNWLAGSGEYERILKALQTAKELGLGR